MDPQQVIDQFFVHDGQMLPDGKTKKSVLLALIEDIKFAILLPGKWRPIAHTEEQNTNLQGMLPSFTVASLFCTGIDVLARVLNKQPAPQRRNRIFFVNCAQEIFGLSDEEANKLWDLRNSIIHTYRLAPQSILEESGEQRIIRQFPSGNWHFYLHAMYIELDKAKGIVYDRLSNETVPDKRLTATYLESHGFFYTV